MRNKKADSKKYSVSQGVSDGAIILCARRAETSVKHSMLSVDPLSGKYGTVQHTILHKNQVPGNRCIATWTHECV